MRIAALSGWTSEQKHVVAASFLGWSLDAFDFFLLVFVLKDIAQEFGTDISNVTLAILLTLAMRPIGAFIFGRAADRWGRRPTLMVDVLLYSIIEFASGFSPNLTVLIVLRALYGVAMGGAFFGESMFHRVTDASKIALVALVEHLREKKFALLDTQWTTPHLKQFGAIEVSRDHYLKVLRRAVELARKF